MSANKIKTKNYKR